MFCIRIIVKLFSVFFFLFFIHTIVLFGQTENKNKTKDYNRKKAPTTSTSYEYSVVHYITYVFILFSLLEVEQV